MVTVTEVRSTAALEPLVNLIVKATPGPANSPGPCAVSVTFATLATEAETFPPKVAVAVIGIVGAVVPADVGTVWWMFPGVSLTVVDGGEADVPAFAGVDMPTRVSVPGELGVVRAGVAGAVVATATAAEPVVPAALPDDGETDVCADVPPAVDPPVADDPVIEEPATAEEPAELLGDGDPDVQPASNSAPAAAIAVSEVRVGEKEETMRKPIVVEWGSGHVRRALMAWSFDRSTAGRVADSCRIDVLSDENHTNRLFVRAGPHRSAEAIDGLGGRGPN